MKIFFAFFCIVLSALAAAEECTVSTYPENTELIKESMSVSPLSIGDKRVYPLDSGDILLVYTNSCGLSRDAMLLLSKPFYSDLEMLEKAKWISIVLYGKNSPIINKITSINDSRTISIIGNGENEYHVFNFNRVYPEDIDVGLFSEVITYTWIPPMGVE